MTTLLTTPLRQWHAENGAKLVPFAGWEMPVQYAGILAEHEQTRTKASVFDICHMGEFVLKGPEVRSVLSTLVTHNLAKLSPGRASYGFMLNENGGIIDDMLVYCKSYESYLIVQNASRIQTDSAWIRSHIPDSVSFEDISTATAKIDVQGPASLEVINAVTRQQWNSLSYFSFGESTFAGSPLLVSRTGYTGELGYELYVPADQAVALWEKICQQPLVEPAGLGARDTLRLEAGLGLYGQDMDEQHTPAEGNMSFFLTSEAEYIGKACAGRVNELLTPLVLEGRRAVRHHDPVFIADTTETQEAGPGKQVGYITSGSFSPSLGHSIALASIDKEAAQAQTFLAGKSKKKLVCKKTTLPFYTKGTARKNVSG